ncbi:MAG: substrate-binding domain-containing protein [Candidatus Omnitrophica bacterium]|nr:substrate-binding domain-containing protein [Candidatus Omnitrophota bacterium]MDD5671095.1 substrate-binding domain-containing protein [Candidatus Omnitrophota bacterium]
MSDGSPKGKSVGLLTAFTPEIFKSEYFTRIISGIIDALRNTEFSLKLVMVKDEEYADPSRKIFREHSLDGLMLLTWRIHPKYIEEAIAGSELPVVIINDYTPELKANIVYCDNKLGVRLALRHLISRGFRKVGILQGPDEASLDARERLQHWTELLRDCDMTFDREHYRKCDYFFEEDGYLKMMDIIHHSKSLPRAMLCFNDDIAIGAIKALKESWIRCPEQVAVIGYDGIDKGRYVDPPLTTIRQPLERMGAEMVNVMTGLIEGKLRGPVQKMFQPELVVRRSC